MSEKFGRELDSKNLAYFFNMNLSCKCMFLASHNINTRNWRVCITHLLILFLLYKTNKMWAFENYPFNWGKCTQIFTEKTLFPFFIAILLQDIQFYCVLSSRSSLIRNNFFSFCMSMAVGYTSREYCF